MVISSKLSMRSTATAKRMHGRKMTANSRYYAAIASYNTNAGDLVSQTPQYIFHVY